MDSLKGLTMAEVEQRRKQGLINRTTKKYTKTKGRIIFENVLSYFNIIMTLIFVLILFTGSYENALFIGVVVSNAFMGIVQELRAKRVVDSLSILTAFKAVVIRDGKKEEIPVDDIVKDDIILIKTGDQISVDAEVISSEGLEVDESLLTGESEPVLKNAGDRLMSGSFAASGSAVAIADNVGESSYAAKLTREAKKNKRANSEILNTINNIIRVMSYIILPLGILLFFSQYTRGAGNYNEAVIGTGGALTGMIPSGLVLISTITLALGVFRCAGHNVLINEPPAVEVLARVNTLCIDKTGTLTDGSLEAQKIITLSHEPEAEIIEILREFPSSFEDKNATAGAIIEKYGSSDKYKIISKVPFSSARKWSSITFEDKGTYVMGAPEMILKGKTNEAHEFAKEGFRVILLAHCKGLIENNSIPDNIRGLAFILISDRIREDAKQVLEHFKKYDVSVKIISGDNPVTVSNIAGRLEIEDADKYIDMSEFSDDDERIYNAASEYKIFGRVSPRQKKNIIAALKKQGNTVAMTGDGVNDVLAMRESDCSIAMAAGSGAARGVAKIVMLNSDFAPLVDVVYEGRRVINNLEKVSSLYLVKTIFSVLLTIYFIITGFKYVLDPVHLTLIGSISVGIPSFFLALEKNVHRIKEGFKKRMINNAIPGGVLISLNCIMLSLLNYSGIISGEVMTMQAVLQTGFISLVVLYCVSRPINLFRGAVVWSMFIIFIAAILIFKDILGLVWLDLMNMLVFAIFAVFYGIIILKFTKHTG